MIRIDHVQVAAPPGCERAAREFYGGILGLEEIAKPASLHGQGGCWFRCGDQQVHVGVEADFRPAKKAHPAFVLDDLEPLRAQLAARGYEIVDDSALEGVTRFFSFDPWGNRLELILDAKFASGSKDHKGSP